MKRFIEVVDRGQATLFPERLEDWVSKDKPVRVVDVFVQALDLGRHCCERAEPEVTDRPSYHPVVLLNFYVF